MKPSFSPARIGSFCSKIDCIFQSSISESIALICRHPINQFSIGCVPDPVTRDTIAAAAPHHRRLTRGVPTDSTVYITVLKRTKLSLCILYYPPPPPPTSTLFLNFSFANKRKFRAISLPPIFSSGLTRRGQLVSLRNDENNRLFVASKDFNFRTLFNPCFSLHTSFARNRLAV